MKFMTLTIIPAETAAEVVAASDKVWANEPKGNRPEASYALMCVPRFDVPQNSIVSVTISESDSAEKIAARVYPMMLAGATVNVIPVLEVVIGGASKAEKKYRG